MRREREIWRRIRRVRGTVAESSFAGKEEEEEGEGESCIEREFIVALKSALVARNVDVVELMEQEERISTDGRAIEFRSCLARKGKISLTCPPRRKFIFVLFSSPFRFFSFSERERERRTNSFHFSVYEGNDSSE